jgi:hypothetical protein
MQDSGTGRSGSVHLARPGRPAVVAATLDKLTGPEHGVVELPQRLMWNPDRSFDLDQPAELRWMYENVLREAIRTEELRRWLNARVLVRIWRELNLPRGVRRAWEDRYAQPRDPPDMGVPARLCGVSVSFQCPQRPSGGVEMMV